MAKISLKDDVPDWVLSIRKHGFNCVVLEADDPRDSEGYMSQILVVIQGNKFTVDCSALKKLGLELVQEISAVDAAEEVHERKGD